MTSYICLQRKWFCLGVFYLKVNYERAKRTNYLSKGLITEMAYSNIQITVIMSTYARTLIFTDLTGPA